MRARALVMMTLLGSTGGCGLVLDFDPHDDGGAWGRDAGSPDAAPGQDDGGGWDAGMTDAGRGDGGGNGDDASAGEGDAGAVDAGHRDAQAPDGGASDRCDPSAVEFPMGGSLMTGTFCDVVYVCAEDEVQAELVRAAAPSFGCAAIPDGPCAGWTCTYETGVLDAAAVAQICAVTQLMPQPRILCRVFL